jgi:anti-sigma factor RsiW
MSSWHVADDTARAYADGVLDDPSSWSLEAHVEQCSACARRVSSAADPVVLARVREHVDARVRPGARGLLRLTVRPALGAAWLVAVTGVVAGVLVLDVLEATRVPSLLLLAPLLPLLGLAVGCSPSTDRSAELLASTPVSTLYVLLLRAGAVLCVSVPPLLLISLVTGTGRCAGWPPRPVWSPWPWRCRPV